ncbi:SRPBCC family protein [Puniceicoccus vermicola]|uniref:SRPBCC family protein n=1 Tax=Puniceicoccus vermicola TaxID=388746 RepID=A0A7X1AWK9_9BACT|nr:SRPBCC family protein [Puniceicoccus vermicola]MBC2601306.1 SRPBCC family protein [Puniceicoccus vermicola]
MPFLQTEAIIPLPREEVFPFFALAENLEKITPDSLKFEILTPLPIEMEEGVLIDYRLRIGGIPQSWQTLISRWDPPFQFVDEQMKGPYRKWVHTHTFRECDAGTEMTDRVEYELPFGPLGKIAHPIIRRQLRKIFTHRNAVIGDFFTIPKSSGIVRGPIVFG